MKKKNRIKIFVFLCLFLAPVFSFANIYPENAQTLLIINNTDEISFNQLILDNPESINRTILSISVQAKEVAKTVLYCNGYEIYNSQASKNTSSFQVFTHTECEYALYADVVKYSTIRIIYVDYANEILPTVNLFSKFSQGEMFISLLLLIGLVLAMIAMLRKAIFSVPVHRKFTGVNQWEGKEKIRI